MGLPADVGVDRQRHDLGTVLALGVKPIELINRAPRQIIAFVMLHDHHRDVVDLDRIGQRDERALGGADHRRLVVIDPVADIFHTGIDQQFWRLQRLGQAWSKPADRALAGEAFEDVHGAVDHLRLILDLVDRHLIIGVAHELPAEALSFFGDARVVLAGAGVDGESRPNPQPFIEIEEAPGAHPHPVFVPAPVRHVRQQRHACRCRQHLPRHRPADVPDLVVHDGPEHDPGVARQLERRPIDDG